MVAKVAAFLSYAHDDDKHDNNRITRLRDRLELSIRVTAGIRDFVIIQDKTEIGWGAEWEAIIRESIDAAVLLFPVISPLWFASPHCRDEMAKFQARQTKLGLTGLILPIYYRETALMKQDDAHGDAAERAVATTLRAIQYEDWRQMRRTEETDPAYADAIERIAERAIPVLKGVKAAMAGKPKPPPSAVEASQATVSAAPDKPLAQDPTPKPIPTKIVDPLGRGDFTTIGAAVKSSPIGTRILVRPGHYTESIVIDKPIEVIGDGDRDDIVVVAEKTATIIFDTNIGTVRNITLRQHGTNNYGVWIKQGRLTLEDCDITSDALSCLVVERGADPRVRRNRIHDGKQAGILVHAGGRGTFEDNDIFANALAGIEVTSKADPIVRRNRIRDSKQVGIHVYDDGLGLYEDNTITGNASAGIHVRTNAAITARKNTIRQNGTEGVWAATGGGGVFEDNDLTDNARGPWRIEPASTAKVTKKGNKEK